VRGGVNTSSLTRVNREHTTSKNLSRQVSHVLCFNSSLEVSLATLASVARRVPRSTRIQPPRVFGGAWMRSKDRAGGGDMYTTRARGSNPASNATGHPGLGRILRRRTGCGRRGASGGMASAWLVVAVLVTHVASVNAVFKPTTKDELSYAIASCLTNVASGVQCCAASPYCNSGAGTASFTDDIGDWDISLITDMSFLFLNQASFNADISGWNTSQVTYMGDMFWGASVFNQPIGNWDTSQVMNMNEMFGRAYKFNQDITGWDIARVNSWGGSPMFDQATAWQARYKNCGYSSNSLHAECVAFTNAGGSFDTSIISDDGPPSAWVRKDNACDAAVPPTNGAAGTCTDTLASGSTCQPECDSGYTVSGATSCTDRVLTAATCTAAVASCTTTQYLTGGACASCPDGSVSRGGDSTVCYCPENFHRVVDAGAAGGYDCSACDAGQYRGPGDAVPTAASSASTRCFAKLNHDAWNGIKTIRSEDPYVLRYDKDLGKDVAIDVDHIIVLASADIDETYDYSRFNWYSRDPPPIHKESFGERSSVLVGGGAAFRDGSVAVSSISTNGAWVVVGSPRTNQAFVYLCSMLPTPGCNSATMAQPFGGPGYFGHSVAIDGNTLVVGESALGGANAGVAHVYTHTHPTGDPTGWILRATLQADDGRSYDEFGRSVAISGDTIVVGAPGFTPNGVAYVFTRTDAGSPTATWTQTAKLRPSFTDTNTYGQSVSVDGNLAAVGCYLKEKASVFVRDLPGDPTSSWSLEATLGTDDNDKHGHVSAKVVVKDYNLFVAAPGDPTHVSSQSGAVLVFSRDPATKTWAKLRELNSEKPIGTRDNFGRSIAFDATSDHGPTLVAGAYHPDDTLRGAAYVFATDAAQSCAGQVCSGGSSSSAPSGAGGNDTANPPPPPPALILDDDDFAVGTDGGRAVAVATACALAVIALMG
jgi:surface protein